MGTALKSETKDYQDVLGEGGCGLQAKELLEHTPDQSYTQR